MSAVIDVLVTVIIALGAVIVIVGALVAVAAILNRGALWLSDVNERHHRRVRR